MTSKYFLNCQAKYLDVLQMEHKETIQPLNCKHVVNGGTLLGLGHLDQPSSNQLRMEPNAENSVEVDTECVQTAITAYCGDSVMD